MDDSLLTELVGQHPSLYDPKNKHYKEQTVKDNVWKDIAGVLKQSVDNCKKRWKNIRDTNNRRKRTGKLPTGSTTSTKASKWYLEDVLSFLNTVECDRKITSNIPDSKVLDSSSDEEDRNTPKVGENEPTEFTQNQQETPLEKTVLSEENMSSPNADIQNERTPGTIGHIKKKRSAIISHSHGSKRQNTSEKVFDIIQRNSDARSERYARLFYAIETRNVENHPIDAFFKSMAMSVKQLSVSSQIRAKMEICRIVGELELMELQQPSYSMSAASQPSSRPSTSFSIRTVYSPEACTIEPTLSDGTSAISQQYSQ